VDPEIAKGTVYTPVTTSPPSTEISITPVLPGSGGGGWVAGDGARDGFMGDGGTAGVFASGCGIAAAIASGTRAKSNVRRIVV